MGLSCVFTLNVCLLNAIKIFIEWRGEKKKRNNIVTKMTWFGSVRLN